MTLPRQQISNVFNGVGKPLDVRSFKHSIQAAKPEPMVLTTP